MEQKMLFSMPRPLPPPAAVMNQVSSWPLPSGSLKVQALAYSMISSRVVGISMPKASNQSVRIAAAQMPSCMPYLVMKAISPLLALVE